MSGEDGACAARSRSTAEPGLDQLEPDSSVQGAGYRWRGLGAVFEVGVVVAGCGVHDAAGQSGGHGLTSWSRLKDRAAESSRWAMTSRSTGADRAGHRRR
jgi:hypothetical protein